MKKTQVGESAVAVAEKWANEGISQFRNTNPRDSKEEILLPNGIWVSRWVSICYVDFMFDKIAKVAGLRKGKNKYAAMLRTMFHEIAMRNIMDVREQRGPFHVKEVKRLICYTPVVVYPVVEQLTLVVNPFKAVSLEGFNVISAI